MTKYWLVGHDIGANVAFSLALRYQNRLHGAMVGNQEALDGFVSVVSGVVSPVDFFSERNVQRIFARARTG